MPDDLMSHLKTLEDAADRNEADLESARAVVERLEKEGEIIAAQIENVMAQISTSSGQVVQQEQAQPDKVDGKMILDELKNNTEAKGQNAKIDWDLIRLSLKENPAQYVRIRTMIEKKLCPIVLPKRFEKRLYAVKGERFPIHKNTYYYPIVSLHEIDQSERVTYEGMRDMYDEMGLPQINETDYEAMSHLLDKKSRQQDCWTGELQVSFVNRDGKVGMGMVGPSASAAARFATTVEVVDIDHLIELAKWYNQPLYYGDSVNWQLFQKAMEISPDNISKLNKLIEEYGVPKIQQVRRIFSADHIIYTFKIIVRNGDKEEVVLSVEYKE